MRVVMRLGSLVRQIFGHAHHTSQTVDRQLQTAYTVTSHSTILADKTVVSADSTLLTKPKLNTHFQLLS